MENSNMAEANHQVGMINVGAIFSAILLVLALVALGVDKLANTRPIDHTDANCIYYADQRAPVVVCKANSPEVSQP